MKKRRAPTARWLVCLRNDVYPVSLERGKLYRAVPDRVAQKARRVRVVDESGEDYLYPADFFQVISLPLRLHRSLTKVPPGLKPARPIRRKRATA